MPWTFKDGTAWDGETHELAGKTFSGKTRTPSSRPLVWTEEKPKQVNKVSRPASSSMPKRKPAKRGKPDA